MATGRAQAAWAARRALVEGAAATPERVAAASGLALRTLAEAHRVAEEIEAGRMVPPAEETRREVTANDRGGD
jgi:hypothetical protein